MSVRKDTDGKLYYFLDIDLHSRQIISWDVERKDQVKVQLEGDCHRLFISKGQYNKLISELEQARRDL